MLRFILEMLKVSLKSKIMSNIRKTILIKSSSSTGLPMASNAEAHTLFYFCKWLSKENYIVVSGIENKTNILKNLMFILMRIRDFIKFSIFYKVNM